MREAVLYFLVSIMALGFDMGVFSFALRVLHASWSLAATAGFLAGVGLAYLLSVRWVFRARTYRRQQRMEAISFVAIGVIGLLITQLILWLTIEKMDWNPELSRLGAAGVTFVFNFTVRKLILFSKAEG